MLGWDAVIVVTCFAMHSVATNLYVMYTYLVICAMTYNTMEHSMQV